MQNNRRLGKLHDIFCLIEPGVRYIVLELNQHDYITFTSCEGHNDDRLPKVGILCNNLKYATDLICYIQTLNLNVWYTLSNRWICTDGSEINTSDETNRKMVTSDLDINWNSCYFLTLITKTLDDLKTLSKLLCKLK